MPQIILVFSSAATAEYRVAGIPAAARAVQAVGTIAGQDDIRRCAIVVDEAWLPSDALLAECRRLAPRLPLAFAARPSAGDILTVCGERFVAALARRPDGGREHVLPALFDARVDARSAAAARAPEAGLRLLRRAGCDVLAATGKGGDGIVSRYVNRPISRAISQQLLRFPAVTPFHASLGTAALGLAMTVALVFGGAAGLVAGALLFQAASIFDGVDGEIARATCRSSDAGATLDSVIDACTNLAFVTGVTANLALAGDRSGAVAGGIALISLAAGLLLIGRHASATGAAMNFDVIKLHLRRGGPPSPLTEFLIHLTMRDFFAAVSAVMVVAGLTHLLLVAFATIASGWLVVTSVILGIIRRRAGLAAPTYSGGATIKPVR